MYRDNQLVILEPGETHLTTVLTNDKKCAYFGTDHSKSKYIYKFKDACDIIDKRLAELYNDPWIEITEKQYDEMLNCLPPLRWHQTKTYSIFAMSEFMEDRYTSFYIYLYGIEKYYTAIRLYDKTDNELIKELDKQLKK